MRILKAPGLAAGATLLITVALAIMYGVVFGAILLAAYIGWGVYSIPAGVALVVFCCMFLAALVSE